MQFFNAMKRAGEFITFKTPLCNKIISVPCRCLLHSASRCPSCGTERKAYFCPTTIDFVLSTTNRNSLSTPVETWTSYTCVCGGGEGYWVGSNGLNQLVTVHWEDCFFAEREYIAYTDGFFVGGSTHETIF